ncbi:MAG: hypothetical protein ACK5XN_25525, partial [Bacteroidota bacterium]
NLTVHGAMTFPAGISGNLGLFKYGGGTAVISNCAVTGDVEVSQGTLEVLSGTSIGGGGYAFVGSSTELDIATPGLTLATTPAGYMEINGTLTGSASAPGEFYGIGTITGNFTTAATSLYYNDPDIGLTVNGNLTLASGMTYETFFNNISLGSSYAMIHTGGTVAVGGTFSFGIEVGTTIAPGTVIKLIDKTSPGAVTGTFAGLAEGATVTATTGEIFTISYIGGDGNDVVLYVPVASTVATIVSYSVSDGIGAEAGLRVFDMTATGTPSASYNLEASIDLVNWSVVQTVAADSITGALSFHVAQSPVTFPKRFFRVQSP